MRCRGYNVGVSYVEQLEHVATALRLMSPAVASAVIATCAIVAPERETFRRAAHRVAERHHLIVTIDVEDQSASAWFFRNEAKRERR